MTFLQNKGITAPDAVKPGWNHIGGIALDAAIQPQRHYETVVRPRVEALIANYPEAATSSGFLSLSRTRDLVEVVNYAYPARVHLSSQIAEVFLDHGVDTVADLQATMTTPESRQALRSSLGELKYVGSKTLGYIDILTGNPDGVAVDSRVRRVLAAAGIEDTSYSHAEAVIRGAAAELAWPAGGLDAVLWRLGEVSDPKQPDAATSEPETV